MTFFHFSESLSSSGYFSVFFFFGIVHMRKAGFMESQVTRDEAVELLATNGILLPTVHVQPVGLYQTVRIDPTHHQLHTSGIGSYDPKGRPICGVACPSEHRGTWERLLHSTPRFMEQSQLIEAARFAAFRVLAEVHRTAGLSAIEKLLDLCVVIQGVLGVQDLPLIADGASKVFRDAGELLGWKSELPTRMTTCAISLPLGLAVELKVVFQLKPPETPP